MKLTAVCALYALSAMLFLLVGIVVSGNEFTELLAVGQIADMLSVFTVETQEFMP